MRGILFTICTLVFSVAFAQTTTLPTEPALAPVQAKSAFPKLKFGDDQKLWVEVNFPLSENGGFDGYPDYPEVGYNASRTKSQGKGGFTVAMKPFTNSSGNKVKVFLRQVGVTANVTLNDTQPSSVWDVVVAEKFELLSPFETQTKCGGQYAGGKQCVSCGMTEAGFVQTCTYEATYGSYVPIRYSNGSAALGMYLPVTWGKLVAHAGVNARLHLTQEGQTSDNLERGTAVSYGATVRVAYPLWGPNQMLTGAYEQSFAGSKNGPSMFKYKQASVGISIALGSSRKKKVK
jgi:hypothetical protein